MDPVYLQPQKMNTFQDMYMALVPEQLEEVINEPDDEILRSISMLIVQCDIHHHHKRIATLNQNEKDTLLLFAAMHNMMGNVDVLIRAGASPCHSTSVCDKLTLHILAVIDNASPLYYILTHHRESISIDIQDTLGWTPLLLAIYHSQYNTALRLLACGASVDITLISTADDVDDDPYKNTIWGLLPCDYSEAPSYTKSKLISILVRSPTAPLRFKQNAKLYMSRIRSLDAIVSQYLYA